MINFTLNFIFIINLDIFDDKSNGIFQILDDAIKIQCKNSQIFLENIFTCWKNNARLIKPRKTESNEFIIRHFSGDVVYDVVSRVF